jgi:flagellar biogenesis protein FliO
VSPLTAYVIETVVTLLGVIALAIAVLYGARRLGVGRPSGPLQLVGRLPLDGRRAVYLIKVGSVVYVVGASEAGLNKLGQLSGDGIDFAAAEEPRGAFAEALARAVAGARGNRKPASEAGPAENDAA